MVIEPPLGAIPIQNANCRRPKGASLLLGPMRRKKVHGYRTRNPRDKKTKEIVLDCDGAHHLITLLVSSTIPGTCWTS